MRKSAAEAERGYRKGEEGKGKNQKTVRERKEKEARRSPVFLKRFAKLSFFGRSNGRVSPKLLKSEMKWGSKIDLVFAFE